MCYDVHKCNKKKTKKTKAKNGNENKKIIMYYTFKINNQTYSKIHQLTDYCAKKK